MNRTFTAKYFDISLIKVYHKIKKLWKFEYLEMGCNESGHIVGFKCDVTQPIRYAYSK